MYEHDNFSHCLSGYACFTRTLCTLNFKRSDSAQNKAEFDSHSIVHRLARSISDPEVARSNTVGCQLHVRS